MSSTQSARTPAATGRDARLWVLLFARTAVTLALQLLLAAAFALNGQTEPLRRAAAWWPVYATLTDVACLLVMRAGLKAEGLSLGAFIGRVRWRDLALGLMIFALSFPVFALSGVLAQSWLYASPDALRADISTAAFLPVWAKIYAMCAWWVIWSPTEEATYQVFVMPRLSERLGSPWLAGAVVAVVWAAQHCALGFVPDLHFLAYRFLAFLPGVCVLLLLYARIRRLAPLALGHWPLDIAGAAFTVFM
jgi:hypothetical protein